MNNTIVYKRSIVSIFLLVVSFAITAQTKYKESFDVHGEDVVVAVNTAYTNIIFETWNKNKVEVEATVEGENLTKEEKAEILDSWNLEVLGNSNRVVISSFPQQSWGNVNALSNLDALKELEFLGPMLKDMPMLTTMKVPAFPEDLMRDFGNLQFDYEAFQKNEEGYMKKWEQEVKEKFGKDFEMKMEKWANEFANEWNEKNGGKISEELQSNMKAWEEKFGKEMENWGENFGKDMEKWAEEFENTYGKDGNFTKKIITDPQGNKTIILRSDTTGKVKNVKAKKTIIIRMPKNAKTEIDVRHGEIKMADVMNVKAKLNYSPFTANSIDGGETLINAAYAPVIINNWKHGTLYVKFVDNCTISTIDRINLRANSSDILIGTIVKDADLTGSLGNIKIDNIASTFRKISITLKNNDAILITPTSDFTFYFTGKKSTLRYPKSLQLTNTKRGENVYVQGFKTNRNLNKTITINALYSNLQVQ
ncbi:hypothetical protein ACFQO1_03975 [Jejudonia soesokkakensis]|uniref:Uncharacterized protein n=1 Tax=Jejudonia soesokkakensis TaxID=1323432 RepID=A0ABW2MPK7_9FLAO